MCAFIVFQLNSIKEMFTVACAFASDVWHYQSLPVTQVCKLIAVICRAFDAAS